MERHTYTHTHSEKAAGKVLSWYFLIVVSQLQKCWRSYLLLQVSGWDTVCITVTAIQEAETVQRHHAPLYLSLKLQWHLEGSIHWLFFSFGFAVTSGAKIWRWRELHLNQFSQMKHIINASIWPLGSDLTTPYMHTPHSAQQGLKERS